MEKGARIAKGASNELCMSFNGYFFTSYSSSVFFCCFRCSLCDSAVNKYHDKYHIKGTEIVKLFNFMGHTGTHST